MKPAHLPEEILGTRVVLRKHTLPLAQLMFDYVNKDRVRLRQFLPWVDATLTVQDEIGYINFALNSWEMNLMYDYGMFRLSDNCYMGNIGVHTISWKNDCCEFGYWILGDFEKQGYVSEAVLALEKACFAAGFERLEIRCASNNFKSASIPMRNGYSFEANLRKNSVLSGQRVDTLIFAKLKNNI